MTFTPSRRSVLKTGVAAAAAFPGWISALVGQVLVSPPASAAGARATLSYRQRAVLSALCDDLIPRTDTPGALDAGVPAFIARALGELDEPRVRFARGLQSLDDRAHRLYKKNFAKADAASRHALLQGLSDQLDAATTGVALDFHPDSEIVAVPRVDFLRIPKEDREEVEFFLAARTLCLTAFFTSAPGAALLGHDGLHLFHQTYSGCGAPAVDHSAHDAKEHR